MGARASLGCSWKWGARFLSGAQQCGRCGAVRTARGGPALWPLDAHLFSGNLAFRSEEEKHLSLCKLDRLQVSVVHNTSELQSEALSTSHESWSPALELEGSASGPETRCQTQMHVICREHHSEAQTFDGISFCNKFLFFSQPYICCLSLRIFGKWQTHHGTPAR